MLSWFLILRLNAPTNSRILKENWGSCTAKRFFYCFAVCVKTGGFEVCPCNFVHSFFCKTPGNIYAHEKTTLRRAMWSALQEEPAGDKHKCKIVNGWEYTHSIARRAVLTFHLCLPSHLCVWRCRSQLLGCFSTAVCSSLSEGEGRRVSLPLGASPRPDSAGTRLPSPPVTPPGEHIVVLLVFHRV